MEANELLCYARNYFIYIGNWQPNGTISKKNTSGALWVCLYSYADQKTNAR